MPLEIVKSEKAFEDLVKNLNHFEETIYPKASTLSLEK